MMNELNYYEKVHPILTREQVSSDALSILLNVKTTRIGSKFASQ